MSTTYESPEIFELGKAEAMTLAMAKCGCDCDCCCGKHTASEL